MISGRSNGANIVVDRKALPSDATAEDVVNVAEANSNSAFIDRRDGRHQSGRIGK
jgi:hypothetical protein